MAQALQRASWIWRRGEAGQDEFCDFLATVAIPEVGKRYFLHIAGDSNYTVWMNGQLCAFGQYADYPDYKVYDRVEITDFLRAGLNRMVTVVWYYGIDSQTYQKGEAGLIFEIVDEDDNVITYSDETVLSRPSRDYISGKCHLISGQLGPTYHYDMKGYDGFLELGCEGFEKSHVVPTISKAFRVRPNKKLTLEPRVRGMVCRTGGFKYTTNDERASVNMQYAAISGRYPHEMMKSGDLYFGSPVKFVSESREFDGVFFIVDLGEETAGFLDIDLEVPADCRLDVGFGEHLKDGVCRTSVRGFFAEIELKAGRNTWLHTFRRFGCRYLQFFVHSSEVTVHYAGLRPTLYPLKHKEYKSGNLLRETIYKVCQNTLQQCLHEHYEDCPWREQALYTMDSRNQMLCGYYAFGETEAARASLELISHGVRDDGLLMLCYPAGLDFPIPAFSCMYFVQMDEYIRHSGDVTLAAAVFDKLETIIKTFHKKVQPEGVIENFYGKAPSGKNDYWNFYEWSATMNGHFAETERRLECPINCFYSLAMQSLANICDALGKTEYAIELRARVKSLNAAIAEVFYNPETKLFESFDTIHRGLYTVLTQSLAMLCGAAEGVDTTVMLQAMATNGKTEVGIDLVPNTLSMNAFRFDALLAVDKEKYAPIILAELDRDYLYMLRCGATTFWETIIGADDFADAGSLCHGWSALPVYYYEILDPNGN